MKYIFAILSVCMVVVNSQSVQLNSQSIRPPRPPSNTDPKGTPVPMPFTMPAGAAPRPARVSPPRPKGCSPGCGPTEICAELGASYCRDGVCSVCIKMSSIRFPASALAAMFSQSQPKPQTQPVVPVMPAQPIVQVQPPVNQLEKSKSETQISILEYAAKQRTLPNDNGNKSNKSKPPPPPPPPTSVNSYQVFQENTKLDSSATAVDINKVQDASTPVEQQKGIDLGNIDTQRVKYPIIVTVTEPTPSVGAASQVNAAQINVANGKTAMKAQEASHVAHIDHGQMAKWYQQYQTFKEQQSKPNGAVAANQTPQKVDTFDFATFKKFQNWLRENQQRSKAQDQTTSVQSVTTPVIQPQKPVVSPVVQPQSQPLITGAPQNMNLPSATAQPSNSFDFSSLQQQHTQWLLKQQQQQQQQNRATGSVTQQQPVAINPVTHPAIPVAQVPVQPQNPLNYASMQQQFIQWQLQQRQQQQKQQQQQTNSIPAAAQPQQNTILGNVPQQLTPATPPLTPAQPATFDFAAFQKQYQQWQQEQVKRGQSQTQPAAPTVDYSALRQQWEKQQQRQQQQQTQGQNTVTTNTETAQVPIIPQNQPSSQEIQINVQPNPQSLQAQNTYTYMPQQPANTFNDPFFYDFQTPQQNTFSNNFNPPPQNNNLMDLMMFSSLGFGGGLFAF